MNSKDKEFMTEAYSLIVELEELVKSYGMEDRVLSALVVAVLDVPSDSDLEEISLQSIFSYSLDSQEELEIIKELMHNQFSDPDDDIDTLLGDLGISLN